MAEWPTVTIGELGDVFDGPHATPKIVSEGPIFLGIGALQDGRINLGEKRHVTQDDFKKWTRRVRPQAGDIVFSYETRLGQAAIIPEGLVCCLGRRMGLVRIDQNKILPRFFLYNYISPDFQEFLRRRTVHGATVDRILLTEFPDFPFPCPPLWEQERIASVLSTLDDKIELNRRMNETLESMAQAIFKDWFVDFGPTRAKAEGRDPYLAPEIWDLFPDALDDETGLPERWRFLYFEDLVEAKQGKYVAKSEMFDSAKPEHPFPVWGGNGVRGYVAKKMYDQTVIWMTCRGSNCGLIGFTETPAWISNNAFGCSTKIGAIYATYISLLNESFDDTISGSAQPQITYSSIRKKKLKFAIQEQLWVKFSAIVDPFFSSILGNNRESQTLTQTRDLLLPKLMSGEIRLAEAEKVLESVA